MSSKLNHLEKEAVLKQSRQEMVWCQSQIANSSEVIIPQAEVLDSQLAVAQRLLPILAIVRFGICLMAF